MSPRIFISYKRDSSLDETVALTAYEALTAQGWKVFKDKQSLLGGQDWAATIQDRIYSSDFLVAFLSAESVLSEMLEDEVRMAHDAKRHGGKPVIIPVRLNYDDTFRSPLSAYLNRIHWLTWKGEDDTQALIENLLRAVRGDDDYENLPPQEAPPPPDSGGGGDGVPPPLPSAQIELEDGTMDPDSVFYAERWEDRLAQQLVRQEGKTIVIKGPRQIGKSSLLVRLKKGAQETGKLVALIDFQVFDEDSLGDKEVFLRQFFEVLTDKLKIENRLEERLATKTGGSLTLRCTNYMADYVLPGLDKPLFLAMDEVDRLFGTKFQNDFFRMLRTWHSSRADDEIWKQLDIALVTSTEPMQFIKNPNESPFNVGINLEPHDFSAELVSGLIRLHQTYIGDGVAAPEMRGLHDQLPKLMELFGGQPFLVRRSLFLVANGLTVKGLFDSAASDSGPFGDHLKRHLFRLHGNKDLTDGLLQVLGMKRCEDDVFYRLQSAGLVKRVKDEGGRTLTMPRCGIYEQFFKEHLS